MIDLDLDERLRCRVCLLYELRSAYNEILRNGAPNRLARSRYIADIIISKARKLVTFTDSRSDNTKYCNALGYNNVGQLINLHHEMVLALRRYIRGSNDISIVNMRSALRDAKRLEEELGEYFDEAVALRRDSAFVSARRNDWQRQRKKIIQKQRRLREAEAQRKSPKDLDLQTIFSWLDSALPHS